MMELRISLPEPWVWFDAHDISADAEMIAAMAQVSLESGEATATYLTWLRGLLQKTGIAAMAALAIPDEDPTLMALAWCLIAYGKTPTSPTDLTQIVKAGDWTDEPELAWLAGAPQPTLRATAFRLADELVLTNGDRPIMWRARYAVTMAPELAAVVEFETPTLAYVEEFQEVFDTIMLGTSSGKSQIRG